MSGRKSVEERVRAVFEESARVKAAFLDASLAALLGVVDLVAERLLANRKLLFFGNGGSAADAQHLAAEFVNRFVLDRPALPAIALTTDTSILTSVANDFEYAEVFARQVKALGGEGDVAFALSTSGNSKSVLRAVEACARKGVATVGLTGGDGGELGRIVDHHLCVASTRVVARIQETHILIGHVLCELVDQKLFRPQAGGTASA